MKICVVVPSRDHFTQGGVRIRYRRIEPVLAAEGHSLALALLQDLSDGGAPEHDAYVFSKCHDARALLAAHRLRAAGKLVGVDLFDDYFSMGRDSRFTALRHWMQAAAQLADFVLCSTERMREIARRFAPALPAHVMNDPAEPFDAAALRGALRAKLERAGASGVLELAWFGIGDNPHFRVGLSDLVAFAHELGRVRDGRLRPRLAVLTNERALNARGVALLRRLPVPYTVQTWTEEREARLLERAAVCFLPVNAQNFSIAKSLNRAVSALRAGAQVLSPGYPLYEPLAPFVYRDAASLGADLARRAPVLREDTVEELARVLHEKADPEREGRSLAAFLGAPWSLARPALAEAPVALLLGRKTPAEVQEFARHARALTVATPFCPPEVEADVRFSFAARAGGFEVELGQGGEGIAARELRRIAAEADVPGAALGALQSPMGVAGAYPHVVASVERILAQVLPGVRCYHSEHAPLPWRTGV